MNSSHYTKNPFSIALLISVIFLIGFYLLSFYGLIQSSNESLIGKASRWCERVSSGPFREPINTLSNIGFMVVGLYIFYVISTDKEDKNYFHGINTISLIYAPAVLYLGPGSMLMHGTNTEWGGWADNLSMIMFIIIPWLFNIFSMSKMTTGSFLYIYLSIVIVYSILRALNGWELGIGLNVFGVSIGLWVISEFLYFFWSQTMRIISGFIGFGVLFLFGTSITDIASNFSDYWWIILFWLPALFSNKKPNSTRTIPWFLLGSITYFSAFSIWLTGVPNHVSCDPDSLIQSHGLWHLLSALATLFYFFHYRSEKLT